MKRILKAFDVWKVKVTRKSFTTNTRLPVFLGTAKPT
jgi:hypothetical protein